MMNMQLWLWGVLGVGVCVTLMLIIVAVNRVQESRWWQRLNTKYVSSGHPILSRSFDRPLRYKAEILWKREADGRSTLVHGIIFSNKFKNGDSIVSTDPTREPGEHRAYRDDRMMRLGIPADGVSWESLPKGLFVHEKQVKTSDSIRIFVFDEASVVHPIELTAEELRLFQPDVYPAALVKSPVWREKFLPLLDPELLEREKRQAEIEQEQREFADQKARGIRVERTMLFADNVKFGMGSWINYPDGKRELMGAFFSQVPPLGLNSHNSNLKNDYFEKNRHFMDGQHPRVFFEMYPSFYAINGQRLESGKPYVQRPDGTVEPVELTAEEQKQFTGELLSAPHLFLASDVFLKKISPLIGPPLPKSEPAAPSPISGRTGDTTDNISQPTVK